MRKYFFLIFLFFDASAMLIAHGGVNEISKSNITEIIKIAEKLEINDTFQIKTIRSWWNGRSYDKRYEESVDIIFKPHIVGEYHTINYSLICRKKIDENWDCQKKEHLYIRFDTNQEINILAHKQTQTDIGVLVEVARAANNQRPMTWRRSISEILPKSNGDFIVTFGSYATCARKLTLRRYYKGETNLYSVVWENLRNIDGCASIAGYIDINSLYVVYENDKWIYE